MSEITLTPEQEQEIQESVDNVLPSTKGMIENPAEFVQKLIENTDVPKHLVLRFWALTNNSLKLGFLDKERANILMYYWDMLKVDMIRSVPKQAYDAQMNSDLIQMEMLLIFNLSRSVGNGHFNERIAILSTNNTYAEKILDTDKAPGFFDSIINKLKGR